MGNRRLAGQRLGRRQGHDSCPPPAAIVGGNVDLLPLTDYKRSRMSPDPLDLISSGVKKTINRHGYAFQQAVLRSCDSLIREGPGAAWNIVSAELPASLNGKEIHIDIALQRFRPDASPAFIAAECKRVDPKRGHWCFARSRYGHGFGTARPIVSVFRPDNTNRVFESPWALATESEPYHLGFDLPRRDRDHTEATGADAAGGATTADAKQDGQNASRVALDEAIAQAFRSAGALALMLKEMIARDAPTMVFPVIFTTAQLFVTDTDISEASLKTGDVPRVEVREVKWLWYQTNLNASQRPPFPIDSPFAEMGGLGRSIPIRHTRATAIVHADTGIREFLLFR